MKFWVGITDRDWFRSLSASRPDEVNFWQPSARRAPVRLDPGAPFLFKLHARQGGHIVGGGFFAHYSVAPVRLAWEAFEDKNGAASLPEMVTRIARYRREPVDADSHHIGCFLLSQPFFLPDPDWIAPPVEWAPNIVQGRSYDSNLGEGGRLWARIAPLIGRPTAGGTGRAVAEDAPRYGEPILVLPRLGQGTFRVVVIDAYERRCAVTNERTLPALDAAHVKPFSMSGPHEIENGILLRRDLHALFDRGYITVTTDLKMRVSPRIKAEFENGREYYALEGRSMRRPARGFPAPRSEYLEWHADTVFKS